MPRPKKRRARRIDPRSARRTNIDLADYRLLEQMLVSKPDVVLKAFQANGVQCLGDLPTFRRLWSEDREAADRIATSAASWGIPVWDAGDILASMPPGEV